jgi:NRPS condensation-like uncharacterized protein
MVWYLTKIGNTIIYSFRLCSLRIMPKAQKSIRFKENYESKMSNLIIQTNISKIHWKYINGAFNGAVFAISPSILRRYAVRIIETNRRWLHCKPKTKDY